LCRNVCRTITTIITITTNVQGYAPDLLQRSTPKRTARELLLTKDMGLNAIRLEGKLQDDDLFMQASALGLMVMPGICCCDAWQSWDAWSNHTYTVAMESMASQLRRLKQHPSIVFFFYSSDQLPPPHVEAGYLKVFAQERWAVGKIQSASNTVSPITGASGVKMAGPYGWVRCDFKFGFASSFGGAALVKGSVHGRPWHQINCTHAPLAHRASSLTNH
jgi:exo-1,4-beta-D-glucosaminidase